MVWTKLFGIGDLSPKKFARFVAEQARHLGSMSDPVVDDDDFRIVDGDARLNLANIYLRFLQLPRTARLEYIHQCVLTETTAVENWEGSRELLRPLLRSAGYLRLAELESRAHGDAWDGQLIASHALVGPLFATLVVDGAHHMELVGERHLAEWKVGFAEAFAIATANLRRESDGSFVPISPGLWVAPWPDSYAAARIFVPEVLQRVCTDPFVCVPDRDTLLVADPAISGSVSTLVDFLASERQDSAYPLSNQIFALVGKQLRLLDIAPEDPAFAKYRELLVREAFEVYEAERSTQPEDDTPRYAEYIAAVSPHGELRTYATWVETVDTLLPPTDTVIIMLYDDAGELVNSWKIPWDTLVGAPGLVERTDSILPRWRTLAFPDESWLDRNRQG